MVYHKAPSWALFWPVFMCFCRLQLPFCLFQFYQISTQLCDNGHYLPFFLWHLWCSPRLTSGSSSIFIEMLSLTVSSFFLIAGADGKIKVCDSLWFWFTHQALPVVHEYYFGSVLKYKLYQPSRRYYFVLRKQIFVCHQAVNQLTGICCFSDLANPHLLLDRGELSILHFHSFPLLGYWRTGQVWLDMSKHKSRKNGTVWKAVFI